MTLAGSDLDRIYLFLSMWALCSARIGGFLAIFPLFSWLQLPRSLAAQVSAAIALPIAVLAPDGQIAWIKSLGALELMLYTCKELLVGFTLAMAAGLPFWVAFCAGELIDTYRGSTAGGLFDSAMGQESSVLGSTFMVMALGAFVATGGVGLMGAALFASYAYVPIDQLVPVWSGAKIANLGALGASVLAGGIGLAAAVLIALFCVDVATALATRQARQFQVFELSLNVKNFGFAVLMPGLTIAIFAVLVRDVGRVPELITSMAGLVR